MSVKPRTILSVLTGTAVLGALLYFSFRTDPVPVDLYRIQSGPMRVTIDVDGRTRVRDVYDIAAPISGLARRSPVAVGDPVTGGETVVAVVEPTSPQLLDARSRLEAAAMIEQARAALRVAETDLHRAEQERIHAQSQYGRAQALVERGVSSLTQLEDASQTQEVAVAGVASASARVDMAKGELARAEAALLEPGTADAAEPGLACCVEMRAPVDGVVLAVSVVSERPVAAGTNLVTIGDPADLEIVADLLSSDAVRLAPGAAAAVDRWGGDAPLAARLTRIEPSARTEVSALGIEEQRVDAVFALTSPLPDRTGLGDGFSVFLRIAEWEAADVIQVPLSATFRNGDAWAVFVVSENVARQRLIKIRRRNAVFAEVTDGLTPGEWVVTYPGTALSDGLTVMER
jgi:HlyD family secretion protein